MSTRTIDICDFCKREGDRGTDFAIGFRNVGLASEGLENSYRGESEINKEWHICASCQSGLHGFLEYELPKHLITESEAA